MTHQVNDDAHWRLKGSTGPLAPLLEQVKTGRMGSRRLGALNEITVGCRVWARTEGDVALVRYDVNGDPAGGIVLEIVDTAHVDPDTGEFTLTRAFRTFNPYIGWDHAFTTIPEKCLEPDACETTEPQLIARTIRTFAQHASTHRGPITDRETRLYRDAARLAALTQGATP